MKVLLYLACMCTVALCAPANYGDNAAAPAAAAPAVATPAAATPAATPSDAAVVAPPANVADKDQAAAPQAPAASDDHTEAPVADNQPATPAAPAVSVPLCLPVEVPKPKEGCEWRAIHDERYCIVDHECVDPSLDNFDPAAALLQPPPQVDAANTTANTAANTAAKAADCPFLNPYEQSDVHKESDRGCDTGLPGWSKQEGCTCVFLVSKRDANGCAERFDRLCTRHNENGTKVECPVMKFPDNITENCQLVFVDNAETGCREVKQDCSGAPAAGDKKVEPATNDQFVVDHPGASQQVSQQVPQQTAAPVAPAVAQTAAPVAAQTAAPPAPAPSVAQTEAPAAAQTAAPAAAQTAAPVAAQTEAPAAPAPAAAQTAAPAVAQTAAPSVAQTEAPAAAQTAAPAAAQSAAPPAPQTAAPPASSTAASPAAQPPVNAPAANQNNNGGYNNRIRV